VPVVATDPNGVQDLYRFDGFGRLRSEAMAGGAGRSISYGFLQVTEIPNGGGRRVTTFDRLGRAVGTSAIGFAGATRTTGVSFDERGMIASITTPSTPTSRGAVVLPSFDQLGRLASLRTRSRPGGPEILRESRRYLVGGAGELSADEVEAVEVTEADGDQRRLHVGMDGSVTRTTERTDSGGHSAVRFDTGAFDLLVGSLDSEGNHLSIERDVLGRTTRVVDPDRGVIELSYSAFDEIASVSREGVGTTVFTRDALGRTVFETTGGYLVAYEYDTAPNGVGRLAASEAPGGVREEYEYDAEGRRRRIRYLRGAFDMTVDFDFDDAGRIASVLYPEVDGERLEVRYRYDVNSGVLFRIESDGLEVDWELISHDGSLRPLVERVGGARAEHEYDPVFGVETRTRVRAGTAPTSPLVHDVEVLLAVDGNVVGRRDLVRGRVEGFGYDRRDRLVGWTSVTGTGSSRLERRVNHTYSDGGRLLSVTDRQQVGSGTFSTVATERYVYEPGVRGAGPRAATEQVVVSGSSSSSTLFGYESGRQTTAGGRVVSYTHFDLPAVVSDATTRVYDYDASRHRARVREPGGETVVYAGSFFERRMTSQAAGQNVVFVYGPGGLVAQLRRSDGGASWSTEYVHGDHLGSATVTTDPSGEVVSEQWFGPFGRRLDARGRDQSPGSGVPEALRVGFTGHEQEDAVGLVDMGGRFYDPTQRRFLTPDPIIAEPTATQSWSPYAYVRNNPLTRIDPSGWSDEDLSGFEDEGAWDTSGMDEHDAPGGGFGDHDDLDDGDVDFDPGEAMAGQDEEAANDGTDDYHASSSKSLATTGTQWRRGIEISGPDAEVLRDYVASAVSRSPSLQRMLERVAGRGQAIRFSTVRNARDIPFGAANVRSGGDAGDHLIDVADLDALPPVDTAPPGTSREQVLSHEIAEAAAELELAAYVESLDGDEAADAWNIAHLEALDQENEFRSEVGATGILSDRSATLAGGRVMVSDTYDSGHIDFFFP
jgi:RHS repeat-associated protein